MVKILSAITLVAFAVGVRAQAFQKYYQDFTTSPPFTTTELDRGASILKSNDEKYIVATTTIYQGREVIKVSEFDKVGTPGWTKIYSQFLGATSPSQQRVFKINYNVDNTGYILTGHADDNGGVRTFIMEIDNTGNVVWSKYYGDQNGVGLDIMPTGDGSGYIQVGYTGDHTEHTAFRAGVIRRIDWTGNVLWQKMIDDMPTMAWNGHADYDFAENVLEIEYGGQLYYFVSGSVTYEKSSTDRLEGVLAILLDANGNLIWDGSFTLPFTHSTGVSAVYSPDHGGIFLLMNEAPNNIVSPYDFGRLALVDIGTGVVNGYWGMEITGTPGIEFAHPGIQNRIFMDQGNLRLFGYATAYHYYDGITVIDKNDLYCPMEINIDPNNLSSMSVNYHHVYFNNSWNYDMAVQGFLGTLSGQPPRVHSADMAVIGGVPDNPVDFTMIGYHQNMHSLSLFGGNAGDAAFCKEVVMNSELHALLQPPSNKNQFSTFVSQAASTATVQSMSRTITENPCDPFVIAITEPSNVEESMENALTVTTMGNDLILTPHAEWAASTYIVRLFNINGKEVYHGKIAADGETLRLHPNLTTSGIFMLHVQTPNGHVHVSQKLMLTK